MKTNNKIIMDLSLIPLAYGTQVPIKGFSWKDENQLKSFGEIDTSSYGVGLKLGESSGIVAIDLDYEVDNLHREIMRITGKSPVGKVGKKGVTFFYRYNGEKKKQYTKDSKCVMDLLGEGSYTVLPPSIHPETKLPYKYVSNKKLQDIELNELPFLPTDFVEQMDSLFGIKKQVQNKNKHDDIKLELKEVLSFIKPELYETWLNVGMALKNTYGDKAFKLWDEWSMDSCKYDSRTIEGKWGSFTLCTDGFTVASIYKMAMDNGYETDDTLYSVYRAKKKLKKWKEEGYPVGDFIGIEQMQRSDDVIWHLRKKEFTVITGKPNSGKSEFLDYMIFESAVNCGFKTFYCSFEKDPAKHIESHIHRHCGKSIEERTEKQEEEAERFIAEHFYFYNHAYNSNKIEDILKRIKELKEKVDIDIVVIDPFSDLESDFGSAENNMEHIKRVCILLSKYCKMLNIHIFLVAHPKSFDDKNKWDKNKKKYVPAPMTMYSISGGATFYNKCDNGILIQREDEQTGIKFLKIREQEHDKLGSFLMTYNRKTRRFDEYKMEF